MKRLLPFPAAGLCWLTVLLFIGCASYDRLQVPGRTLNGDKRFFVLSNLNDNHAIDHQIEAALQIRGNTADHGPMTMLPDDAQVIVTYEDRWTWDFGDHLLFLQIVARDRRSQQPVATVRFNAKIPSHQGTAGIVGELIDRLLAGRKS